MLMDSMKETESNISFQFLICWQARGGNITQNIYLEINSSVKAILVQSNETLTELQDNKHF